MFVIADMPVNLVSLHDLIRTDKDTIRFMQQNELVNKTSYCTKCKEQNCRTVRKGSFFFFKCSVCRTEVTVRKDTFLYNKVD